MKIKKEDYIEKPVVASPIPTKKEPQINQVKPMNFFEALEQVSLGKRIHKMEWQNPEYFGIMKDTFLKLHKPDGKFYDWIINDGDMAGIDFIVLP